MLYLFEGFALPFLLCKLTKQFTHFPLSFTVPINRPKQQQHLMSTTVSNSKLQLSAFINHWITNMVWLNAKRLNNIAILNKLSQSYGASLAIWDCVLPAT